MSKTEDLENSQRMLCETVFSNPNLKPSKLQEHFYNRHDRTNVVGHDKNLCDLKQPILFLEQNFFLN